MYSPAAVDVAMTVTMTVTVLGLTNLKLVYELPSGRWRTIVFD